MLNNFFVLVLEMTQQQPEEEEKQEEGEEGAEGDDGEKQDATKEGEEAGEGEGDAASAASKKDAAVASKATGLLCEVHVVTVFDAFLLYLPGMFFCGVLSDAMNVSGVSSDAFVAKKSNPGIRRTIEETDEEKNRQIIEVRTAYT